MADFQEIIFTSVSSEHNIACCAWDFRTGTNLMNYKCSGGTLQSKSLCILGSDFVLAANCTKPLLHVWPINNQEQISSVRFVVPGRVNALALSPDDCYLVAGIQEALYVWCLKTGKLLNTISKHYQSINCIRFTDDGAHFASAGQDGGIVVWNLTQVVCRSNEECQNPLYTFNDHGLPVTDLHMGAGGINCYMYSVSVDRTCKIYDLNSGTLLLSVVFSESLKSVAVNALETSVFVGTEKGNIHEFHIADMPRTKEYHMENKDCKTFAGHKASIDCLALSLDGQVLLSGGSDSNVCLWHIHSRQLLKSISHKGPVTNIKLCLTNPAIFHPDHKQQLNFSCNLRRMLDPLEADDDEIIEIFVGEQEAANNEFNASKPHVHIATPVMPASNSSQNNNSEEVENLRREIKRLKAVNQKLFEVSAKQLLSAKK